MVEIRELTKKYADHVVIDQLSLTLSGGMIYGLSGPNGCGKTTLMRCICGFVKPTSGSIRVNGREIGKDCDFSPDTGIILETPGFLNQATGRKNLQILAGVSRKANAERIDTVIRRVGLDPDETRPVGQYSLGMRQRLGIAQAIMEDPELLLLDEPFNGLDKQAVEDMHHLLLQLRGQGKCILLACHSANDIYRACDIVYIMEHGKIVSTCEKVHE